MELARSLELRSGAYHAPALPVELYQRSGRGDSNADHGLTRPALFPLSYTSTKFWRWRGELHSRMICFAGRCLAVLATPPQTLERSTGIAPVLPASTPPREHRTRRGPRTGDPGYCSYTNSAWVSEE